MPPCRIPSCTLPAVPPPADPRTPLGGPTAPARHTAKPWGHELLWALTPGYAAKEIAIADGERLSLQVHEAKDETMVVLSGVLALGLEDGAGRMRALRLGPGERVHIPAGVRHRPASGGGTVVLMEASTPELGDVVRLADDFGREGTSAA